MEYLIFPLTLQRFFGDNSMVPQQRCYKANRYVAMNRKKSKNFINSLLMILLLVYINLSYAEDSISYWKKECKRGSGVACNRVGVNYVHNKKVVKSLIWFTEGCHLQDTSACYNLFVIADKLHKDRLPADRRSLMTKTKKM